MSHHGQSKHASFLCVLNAVQAYKLHVCQQSFNLIYHPCKQAICRKRSLSRGSELKAELLACRLSFGGSLIRPEATGYGLVYFCQEVLEAKEDSLKVTSPASM